MAHLARERERRAAAFQRMVEKRDREEAEAKRQGKGDWIGFLASLLNR